MQLHPLAAQGPGSTGPMLPEVLMGTEGSGGLTHVRTTLRRLGIGRGVRQLPSLSPALLPEPGVELFQVSRSGSI